jgi:hypothetical protein
MIPLAQVFALEFTAPIWVILLSPLLLAEKLTPQRLGAAALGFAGILIVTRPGVAALNVGVLAGAGAAVCFAIRHQVEKLGLSIGDEPHWHEAQFVPQIDRYSGETSQVGQWKGRQRFGSVTIFPDGKIFAEYQVLQPQPQDPSNFVESVQVWGTLDALKGDAVLIPFIL